MRHEMCSAHVLIFDAAVCHSFNRLPRHGDDHSSDLTKAREPLMWNMQPTAQTRISVVIPVYLFLSRLFA